MVELPSSTGWTSFARCAARIQQLANAGHELRRPAADLLRDGIWELRARCGKEQYRILYFFHGRATVVLVHACRKERRVPEEDLNRAARRRAEFETNPAAHIYAEE